MSDIVCELIRHLYQCSSDHPSPNYKMWVRSATKKVIPNTHMELDMFSIRQIIVVKLIIQRTTQIHIIVKVEKAILKMQCHDHWTNVML